jgi:hypothetical protein
MVREAYSADGRQTSNEAEGTNVQGQPLDIRSAENLTQELAQLLAATIAQGKTGQRTGTPTGSELASLAALIASSSQKQRPIAPSFKDGLSSLSYSAPQPVPAPVQLTEHHPDDEPMPIPSTWRETKPAAEDRWLRQQVGAAVLGLAAGLMVVVPAVLWLSGWFGGPQRAAAATRAAPVERPAEVAPSEVRPVRVQIRPVEKTEVATQYVAATLEPRPINVAAAALEAPTPVPVALPEPAGPSADDLLVQAERRIESGDVVGAREILASTEASAASGALVFALAETYDPNMLAAWGVRGVTADVMKAKSLYLKARDLGIVRAQMRLEQLR